MLAAPARKDLRSQDAGRRGTWQAWFNPYTVPALRIR
jgi:hypothetical protein